LIIGRNMATTTNKIVFPIPNSIKTAYDIPENTGLFDGDNLVLMVSPQNYQLTKTYGNNTPIIGISGSFVKLENIPFEISLTIEDKRDAIARVLRELISIAESEIYNYQLITMLDYHVLETPTGYANGYETRLGALSFEYNGGSFRGDHAVSNSYRYNSGIKILFRGVG
jgi:hypothetical protein